MIVGDSSRWCEIDRVEMLPPTRHEVAAVEARVRTICDMRVFFTGGSGKAGRHAIRHLVEEGHRVVNGDLVALGPHRRALPSAIP